MSFSLREAIDCSSPWGALMLDAPENTLPAFKLAWEQGADAIEGDALTKDNQIVCIHDKTTKRLSDQIW